MKTHTMTSGAVRKHKDKKDKKTHEKKQKKKRKVNRSFREEEDGINYAEDSGEGSVNLCEELHPIGFYINDREEMINQMFSVIKGDKLRAMLPPILKDSTIDELKSHCLDELLGMSSKRIHSVLEGRELETSSDSDDASSKPENENTLGTSPMGSKDQWSSDDMRTRTQDQDLEELDKEDINSDERNGLLNGPVPDIDTLEIGITRKEMGELFNYIPSTKHSERKRTSSTCEAESTVSVVKRNKRKSNSQKKAKESEKQIKVTRKNIAETDEANSPPKSGNINEADMTERTDESKGKTLLEILELEMRARAIRALLKQQICAGDGEDVDHCDEWSETPPSELTKSRSLYTVKDAASIYNHESNNNNLTGSDNFDNSPKSHRQKLKRRGMENIPMNQCTVVNTEQKNNQSLSLVISALPQLPSIQNVELCTLTRTDSTVDPDVHQVTSENISQSSLYSNIKIEVCHGGETRDMGDVKQVPLLESNGKEQESDVHVPHCKEIYETVNTVVTLDEAGREDGELTNDDKSSEGVIEVHSERACNDIIILDDSDDDELQELFDNRKLQKTSLQETDGSQKVSLGNLSEQGNCSYNSTEVSETLNNVSKEYSVKPHKSSVSCDNSGSTPENSAQNESKEFSSSCIEIEINEDYRSENQNKRNENTNCSWAARWLQSKDVQKVVSTSKMCAKVRKRMKSAQKVKRVRSQTTDPEEDCKSSVVVVGSVNEYNMLDKPKCCDSET
ncbi:uncharacterized protein LOC110831136 isoform X2 [Zootermopsis nevadensis]|uniref:Caspase activity and apoptosis inhibitor 1 n=1 Tax=Zootermopsis nevadensis TaxID=136037 RepID=A0A067R6W1_ZOONE|nr:uncharacterized protein LOC110831136 isoform X2 [Zootermopsis nevadensis]KDR18131.1 hypothetical protein L798_07535 [Zootermopsis nevadensis]